MMRTLLFIGLLVLSSSAWATTWYVNRVNGQIVYASQKAQPGYAEEALDDQVDADLQTFLRRAAVPQRVNNWQGQAILAQRGIYDQVVAALAAIADPATKKIAQIAFGSADFTRASPLLNSILKSSPINYSDADIDQLFIDASKLSL